MEVLRAQLRALFDTHGRSEPWSRCGPWGRHARIRLHICPVSPTPPFTNDTRRAWTLKGADRRLLGRPFVMHCAPRSDVTLYAHDGCDVSAARTPHPPAPRAVQGEPSGEPRPRVKVGSRPGVAVASGARCGSGRQAARPAGPPDSRPATPRRRRPGGLRWSGAPEALVDGELAEPVRSFT